MPFSAPVLTYRAKALASNMCSKVLNGHIILTDTSITTILAPEMTYTPKNSYFKAIKVPATAKKACRERTEGRSSGHGNGDRAGHAAARRARLRKRDGACRRTADTTMETGTDQDGSGRRTAGTATETGGIRMPNDGRGCAAGAVSPCICRPRCGPSDVRRDRPADNARRPNRRCGPS